MHCRYKNRRREQVKALRKLPRKRRQERGTSFVFALPSEEFTAQHEVPHRMPGGAERIHAQRTSFRRLGCGGKMKIAKRIKEAAATGYILLWLLGIPIPILLIIFLLRGCT